MDNRPHLHDAYVTNCEVARWFRKHRGPWPSETQCDPITDLLNRIATGPWTHEEYDAAIAVEIDRVRAAAGAAISEREPHKLRREREQGPSELWNVHKTVTAARALVAAIPAMRQHWRGLEWAPETRGGTAALDALDVALAAAMPFIEYPFGKYEASVGRKAAKYWHIPAIRILPLILRAMQDAGHRRPRISRNSPAISVLQSALKRVFGKKEDLGTIAAYVSRRGI